MSAEPAVHGELMYVQARNNPDAALTIRDLREFLRRYDAKHVTTFPDEQELNDNVQLRVTLISGAGTSGAGLVRRIEVEDPR